LFPGMTTTIPRGKVLGGSSSLNGCYFIRGVKDDFDRWAGTGCKQWAYDEVLPYFKRAEADADFGDADEFHGQDGPIPVRRSKNPTPVTEAFTEACLALGYAEDPDKNAPKPGGGVGPVPFNIDEFVQRISTGIGYLVKGPHRPNLTISGNVFVRRVVLDGQRVIGVEVEQRGRREMIYGGEVILAAGAFKSPHLLMLSGIGPADELLANGVSVVRDLPGVGKNFHDHTDLQLSYQPSRDYTPPPGSPPFQTTLHFASSAAGDNGSDIEIAPFIRTFVEVSGGRRIALKMLARPLASARAMRGTSVKPFVFGATHQNHLSFMVALQRQDSLGEVRLVSSDPHEQPQIKYHFLEAESDRLRLREGVRAAVEIMDSPQFSSVCTRRLQPTDSVLRDDKALDASMRDALVLALHTSGTCRMGGGPEAVVDAECRVYGVEGLRVVDTSIIPDGLSRGPSATAVMIGERAAAFFD
jgi:choline dehydrogenase